MDSFSKYLRAHSNELPDEFTPSLLQRVGKWSDNACIILYPVFDFIICIHNYNLYPDANQHIDTAKVHIEGQKLIEGTICFNIGDRSWPNMTAEQTKFLDSVILSQQILVANGLKMCKVFRDYCVDKENELS